MLVGRKLEPEWTQTVQQICLPYSCYLGAESVEDPGVEDDSQDEGNDPDSTEKKKTG